MSGAYSQLLLQVLRDGCTSRMMKRMTVLVLALAVLTPIGTNMIDRRDVGWAVMAGAPAFLILMWCGSFLKSAVQQNHPAYACLVPQLRRRLIVLTTVVWAVSVMLVAGLAAAVVGHFGYLLVAAAFFFCYMLYVQRYSALAFLPSLLILGSVSVLQQPLHALWDVIGPLGEPALAGIGLLAAAALGGAALQQIFPRGGDSHWAWHARHAMLQRRLQGDAPKRGESGNWSRWSMLLRVGYRSALRRDSRGGAAPGSMLLHTFGPAAHEGGYHAYALLVTLAATLAVLCSGSDTFVVRDLMRASMMQACVLVGVMMYAFELVKGATRHGAEQAIYSLAPAAPSAAQLNRVMGAALLKRFMRVWLVAVLCAAGLDMLIQGAPQLYASTCVLSAALLPFSCALLRNYAELPPSPSQMATLVGTFLATVAYLILISVERHVQPFPLFCIGAAIALASLLMLRWRWQRLMTLPPVLPAGRLLA
ncbi:hypothetical protein [Rugamonas aquatica]|uniref:Uncharacterized protein n=1 Tax=Rugamonas aquatica TaxID=2743357 RepID=A0A6A7MTZ6_9BURK|nr:hypothetical protein [Rugamonas aquatica]MQA36576.1 hypothetical protein [Rugamonas aquatica]